MADISGLLRLTCWRAGHIRCGLVRRRRSHTSHKQTRLTFARCGVVDPLSLDDYRAHGGLKGLERAREIGPVANDRDGHAVRSARSRCAGLPTASSGRPLPTHRARRKFIVCNADEGDFPHVRRSTAHGRRSVRADRGHGDRRGSRWVRRRVTYIRARSIRTRSRRSTRHWMSRDGEGTCSAHHFDIEQRVGGGAYVCGEETSLLDSLEGKRGQYAPSRRCPRIRDVRGAYGDQQRHFVGELCPSSWSAAPPAGGEIGMGRSRTPPPIELAGST